MSADRTIKPALYDRLGKQGYTVVARAPRVGLPQLADGSWHIVGGSNPARPELMHEIDHHLIPFILSQGGDVAVYRLSDVSTHLAKLVLSHGGMTSRPPALSRVQPFDPDLVHRLSGLQESLAKPVAPSRQPMMARLRFDRRTAIFVMAGFALLLGLTAYIGTPSQAPDGVSRWVPDMNNPRDAAIAKGATVLVMPRKDDPETLVMYRIYPGAREKGARETVGSFKKQDLEGIKGNLPDSRVKWLHDF